MEKKIKMVYYFIKNKLFVYANKKIKALRRYASRVVLQIDDTNVDIKKRILGETPFCIGRFGATELFCASSYEFDIKRFKEKSLKQLCDWSGFFPDNIEYGNKFNECIKNAISNIDMLAIWNLRFEEYYIKNFAKKDVELFNLADLEPWRNPANPWSAGLEGKKVLVIHPFEKTIWNQYVNREHIFPETNILPQFELKTLKAVQTLAGKRDDRFNTWFDALKWMLNEAMKIEFDVAIIGCGAYGMPLASMLKNEGKKAIHMGGATQILFGIKGKRWDENSKYDYVRSLYNEYWIYPLEEDRIENMDLVEGGCYW